MQALYWNNCGSSTQLKPHPPKSACTAYHVYETNPFPKYVTDVSTPPHTHTHAKLYRFKLTLTSVRCHMFVDTIWVRAIGVSQVYRFSKWERGTDAHTYADRDKENAREREWEREERQQDILSLWLQAADWDFCVVSAVQVKPYDWNQLQSKGHVFWINKASVNGKKHLFHLWGKFPLQTTFFTSFIVIFCLHHFYIEMTEVVLLVLFYVNPVT